MKFLRRERALWRRWGHSKGTTMQRRLLVFFSMVVISLILCFTLLLILFGITGSGRQTIHRYLESELLHISAAAQEDLGNLSVTGIRLAEQLGREAERICAEQGVELAQLVQSRDPALLSAQMSALLSVAEQNPCGGVFLVLDPGTDTDRLPGIFIKKTQPVSSASLAAKTYCLRGSADIARSYGVELLAQWQMDYTAAELPFVRPVVDAARAAPELPLSRLYYWSGRLRLEGNSETGILLCLPLRSADGSVWGVAGIEVSDRMFKQLYSPGESAYQSVFALAAPMQGEDLLAQSGLIAGNSYLTGSQMTQPFAADGGAGREFVYYTGQRDTYGGLVTGLRLYPTGSPFESEQWALAVLMPRALLEEAIRGSSAALFAIVAVLLVGSLVACVFISRRYLRPIHRGLSSIRDKAYATGTADFGVVEIDALFADLAADIRTQQAEMQQLRSAHQASQARVEKAETKLDRLTDKRKQEIDPEEFGVFLANLKKLTVTEQRIFQLYLEGCGPREIMERTQIKENTLKYHNRNIYGKLGVSSRRQLLQFATLMEQNTAKARQEPSC